MTEISGGTAAQPAASGQHDRRGREAALARAFVRLADTLASDFDVVDFLQGLSADAVEILEAEAAGVMLADPRGGLRLIASSDERMRLLELFELQGAQGPCLRDSGVPAGPCGGGREPLAGVRGGGPGGWRVRRVLPAADRGTGWDRHVGPVP